MIYLNLKKFFSNRYVTLCIFLAIYAFIFMMSPFVVDYSADGCKAENPEIKVSVIVPVYNTEKYLPSALDSLTNQTLKDIEIICVNDGSKDNSLAVLNEYKEKDNRIKILYGDTDSNPMYISYTIHLTEEEAKDEVSKIMQHSSLYVEADYLRE